MTIRRQWLMVLFLVAILSVAINTLVLGALTNKSFNIYVEDSYNYQVNKIVEYSNEVLSEHSGSNDYTTLEVNSYLVDPIKGIVIYDSSENILVNVSSRQNLNKGNNGSGMSKMMNRGIDSQFEEIDSIDITHDGKIIGSVSITRNSTIKNSIASRIFMSNLFVNSAKSVAIVLAIAFIIGGFVSKKMSKELVLTANKAQSIEIGNKSEDVRSKVKEIQVIEHSLDSLRVKLDLKQRSRKKLIDELIHQTRTPLTILKTHIEGYEDGVIELNDDETTILIHEVDNVTSIISNLSAMIDAEKDYESIEVTSVDICGLISQITAGLRLQFEKKNINLSLNCDGKTTANTDKYKLSQVIYNVLTNAYKYTNDGGYVSIGLTKENDKFLIQITDSGLGIKIEDRENIFNAYFRSQVKNDSPGDGIGLYVAKENMKQISGEIKLDENYDNGSKFIIEFIDI
ncbi:MAG: HAMP domain-containing sensor histidine kinase [Acidaminobacteraceae bacterium]